MPGKESGPQREPEQEPYLRAARYQSDSAALAAYTRVQELIFSAQCDLSSFRIRYRDVPHVVVLGRNPEPEVDTNLVRILDSGEPTALPVDVVGALLQRRQRAGRLGPWVERHYREPS